MISTFKKHKPVSFITKAIEIRNDTRKTIFEKMDEPFESPSFVLIEYTDGTRIPAPLVMSFKDMIKHSRRIDYATLKTWLTAALFDKNRAKKMMKDYMAQHEAWKDYYVR